MTTPTTVNVRLQLRADTAANWTAANPTLLANEVGLETDTKKLKVGNGSSAWNSLAYFPSIVSGGTVLGNLEIGSTGTLTFEGSTADGFETTLAVTNPTADRTITLPNQSGTVVVSGNASIVDADIAANAEIAVSKLADGAARQLLQTDAAGTGVEWTSNIDIPGSLDVTGPATFDGAVIVGGDLTVNGTTTNINTQNLVVEDKNIILGDVATPSDTTADAGGITLKGATDKTINWYDATDAWTSSERFSVPLGSAASPSLTFTGDENTGIYSPGADQVAISTNGTGRLFVDASGNVCLKKEPTNPNYSKALTVVATDAAIALRANSTGTYTDQGIFFAVDGVNYSQIYNDGIGELIFRTGSGLGERLRITSAGLVGVGTSAPQTDLQVGNGGGTGAQATAKGTLQISAAPANLTNAGGLEFKTSEFGSGYGWKIAGCADGSANPLIIGNRNNSATWSPRLFISAGGNVGIGTTSPSELLHVVGSGTATIRVATSDTSGAAVGRFRAVYPGGGGGTTSAVDLRAGDGYGYLLAENNVPLLFGTNNTERARIDSSGRLLVGTSSAPSVVAGYGSNDIQLVNQASVACIANVSTANSGFGAQILLAKSRGGTSTVVQNGDIYGQIRWAGADGTDIDSTAASIEAVVDGTPGANDMPGRIVLSTTLDGASSPTEALRITNDAVVAYNQAAPAAVNTTATLTVANLKTGIITSTTAAAVTMTLPTGTLTEGGFSGAYNNMTFEWSVINTGGTNAVTVQAGTDHTLVGSGTVSANNSGRFATRRTALNTWVTYRLSS